MSCETNFPKLFPTECVLDIATTVINGGMSVALAKKILWTTGSVLEVFGDGLAKEAQKADTVIVFAAGTPVDMNDMIEVSKALKESIPVGNDLPMQLRANAINPQTIALLFQLAKLALEVLQSFR